MAEPAPSDGERRADGPPYRFEDGTALIELKLSTLAQLFNSIDPAPFHEKDLDPEAEDYIVGAAEELSPKVPIKIVLHLPAKELSAAEAAGMETAIRNYFAYRRANARRDLRQLMRIGRISLLVGLSFLALCMVARAGLQAAATDPISQILTEGLLIMGWVALWRPTEIFLYDWWPIWRTARVHGRLAAAAVELRGEGAPLAAH
jgi:hypothetical protein